MFILDIEELIDHAIEKEKRVFITYADSDKEREIIPISIFRDIERSKCYLNATTADTKEYRKFIVEKIQNARMSVEDIVPDEETHDSDIWEIYEDISKRVISIFNNANIMGEDSPYNILTFSYLEFASHFKQDYSKKPAVYSGVWLSLRNIAVSCIYALTYPKVNADAVSDIADKLYKTYKRKNADYGNSFSELYEEDGIMTVKVRIGDKYKRYYNITTKNELRVKDESVRDTLEDMANYAIMAMNEIRKEK